MAATVESLKPARCYFFDELPAEVRNEVYQLVFPLNMKPKAGKNGDHGATTGSRRIHLLNAKGPEISVLLTCRQAYTEARKLYELATREYWRSSRFRLVGSNLDSLFTRKHKKLILSKNFDIIQHLTIAPEVGLRIRLEHLNGRRFWEVLPPGILREFAYVVVYEDGFTAYDYDEFDKMYEVLSSAEFAEVPLIDQVRKLRKFYIEEL